MTTTQAGLKSCPFCNGEAERLRNYYNDDVQCKKCGAIGGFINWNDRPAKDPQVLVDCLKEIKEYSLGSAGDDCTIFRIIDKALKQWEEQI